MKRSVVAALLWFAVLGTQVWGQVPDAMKVHFAQSVAVGESWLPAGDYTIRLVPATSQPLLAIQSEHQSIVFPVMLCTVPGGDVSKKTQITLEQHGGRLHLTKVWFGGRDYGYEVISRPR